MWPKLNAPLSHLSGNHGEQEGMSAIKYGLLTRTKRSDYIMPSMSNL
jgi:hypothetical protein